MGNPFSKIYEDCNSGVIPDFPYLVDIELTNTCNLKCQYCPTGQGTAEREKGFMKGNIWCKILKELIEHQTPVRFARWGEPTLHKKVYDWIAEAKGKNLLTHLTTNGKLLRVYEVLDCGLDSIKFSVHDYDPSEKIKTLYKSSPRPYITVTPYAKMRDLSLPSDTHTKCPEVFGKLSVNWDGLVSACCGDYDNLMIIGDMKKNTLREIWNGSELSKYRQMLVDKKYEELPLCRNCRL